VCAGGIIGLGEGDQDRVGLLLQLATLPEHPESVPINRLVAVKGTPLQVRAGHSCGTSDTTPHHTMLFQNGFQQQAHLQSNSSRCYWP
jgi:hypothetical protein